MQLEVSTLVRAPQSEVFAVMTDISGWPRTISAIESIEWLAGEPGAQGSIFRETRIMHGRRASEEMTIAECDPPHRFVLTASAHGARYRAEHTLTPEPDGTRLTLVFSGAPETLFARLMTPVGWLFRGAVKAQLLADLADLKGAAEAAV